MLKREEEEGRGRWDRGGESRLRSATSIKEGGGGGGRVRVLGSSRA